MEARTAYSYLGDELPAFARAVRWKGYFSSLIRPNLGSDVLEVGAGLGAQAGEKKLREIITLGGFKTVRRATETPFNMVLEARL